MAFVTTELNLRWDEAQVVPVGASSATSKAAAGNDSVTVLLNPSCDCWIKAGAAPTATKDGTVGSLFLAKGSMFVLVLPKNGLVAVIQDGSSTGYLNVVPVGQAGT